MTGNKFYDSLITVLLFHFELLSIWTLLSPPETC